MLQQREEHYSGIEEMLDPKKSFHPVYDKLFHKDQGIPFFSKIGEETILDRTRGYLVGVFNSDEQNTIRALSNLNPLQLRLNPGLNSFYGGFYYYTSGAFLLGTKLVGLAQFPSDLKFYFSHPQETQKMYLAVRLLSALSVFLTLCLLLFCTSKFIEIKVSTLASLFFVLIPLLVPYSHMAKAHTYGMFLTFLGFLFIGKTFKDTSTKNYILGGLFLGLSAGTIITNLTVGIILFFAEWIRNQWSLFQVFKSKKFWIAVLTFFVVYFLTNYYVFTHLSNFQRSVLALKEYTSGYDEYGKLNLKNWFPFLKDMFTNQIHWSYLPWLLLGCYPVLKSKNPFLQVTLLSFVFLTLFNLTLTRHAGINLRVFPFIAILSAYGFQQIFQKRWVVLKIFSIALLFLTLFLSGAQTLFYTSLYQGPSHLTQAGNWINQNIPKGESIGVIGTQFSQNSFPPFHFLNYSLISFPNSSQKEKLGTVPLGTVPNFPTYVVTSIPQEEHPILSSQYRIIQNWKSPNKFLGIYFPSRWALNEKTDLSIYKKSQ